MKTSISILKQRPPILWRTAKPQSIQSERNLISLNLWPALALILAVSSFDCRAQGTVFFTNTGFPITTNDLHGATGKIAPHSYYFGLYMGTSAAEVQNSITPVLVVLNNGFAGEIGGSDHLLPGFNAGSSYYFQVKGWSVTGGSVSYETALMTDPSGYFGVSQIGTVFLTLPDQGGSGLFGPNYPEVPAFVMTPIPEPSAFALGGLALAAWAGWRWRRPD